MADITASFAPISPVSPSTPGRDFAAAAAEMAGASTITTPAVGQVDSPGFAAVLDQISAVEAKANTAAVDLATGKLENPHEFTALAAQARLTVELTAAVRNRAVEAFNEVMRMQV